MSTAKKNDGEWEELDVKGGKTGGMAGLSKKFGGKKNSTLIMGSVAGGLLLVVVLVLGLALGWFSGGEGRAAPAVAMQSEPQTPLSPPVQASSEIAPSDSMQPVVPSQETTEPTPVESDQKMASLSEDISTWKKDDYFRARKENNPKLLLALAYLSEKTRGSEPAAQGLTELLKPLPVEKPVEAASPEAAAMPQPGPRSSMPPGGMVPGGLVPGVPPPMAGAMGTNPDTPNTMGFPQLVEAIITALGENGTTLARKTLEEIIMGTLKTDDDKVAVEAALKALVTHPCPENDAILLHAITSPETLRPTDREGPWPAKNLQLKAFELAKTSASLGLRAKLAEWMPDRVMRIVQNNPLRDLLIASNPLNCGAQIVFYRKKNLGDEFEPMVERQLAAYSAYALSRLLNIPTDGQNGGHFSTSPSGGVGIPGGRIGVPGGRIGIPGGGIGIPDGGIGVPGGEMELPGKDSEQLDNEPAPSGNGIIPSDSSPPLSDSTASESSSEEVEKKPDNTLALQVADLLWSEDFCGVLTSPLEELLSLEKKPDLLMLISTIPQDCTRVALAKLFRKRWQDGTGFLEASGFLDRVMTDPGLLVLMKMMPRKDHGGVNYTLPQQPRGNQLVPEGRPADTLRPAQKKAMAEQGWMNVSTKLVSAWRKWFQTAALAKKKIERNRGLAVEPAPADVPSDFTLNTGAKVVASYHLVWPKDAPDGLTIPKPSFLEIHYLYIEETNTPKKCINYYARQVQTRPSNAKSIDNSTWFDSMKVLPETDRRRSIDVFVTRPHNAAADIMRDDMEADLVIELMTIEIKNPFHRD